MNFKNIKLSNDKSELMWNEHGQKKSSIDKHYCNIENFSQTNQNFEVKALNKFNTLFSSCMDPLLFHLRSIFDIMAPTQDLFDDHKIDYDRDGCAVISVELEHWVPSSDENGHVKW
ncbi:hypothetical protein P9112_008233 [Eukaryota sp. TZLM1-RC]